MFPLLQFVALERLAHMHPAELYVWPKSVPLMHRRAVYFLLARRRGFSLLLDTAWLGRLAFDPRERRFKAELQPAEDSALKG